MHLLGQILSSSRSQGGGRVGGCCLILRFRLCLYPTAARLPAPVTLPPPMHPHTRDQENHCNNCDCYRDTDTYTDERDQHAGAERSPIPSGRVIPAVPVLWDDADSALVEAAVALEALPVTVSAEPPGAGSPDPPAGVTSPSTMGDMFAGMRLIGVW